MPIGAFQALPHRMVQLALEIEQSRSAVINPAAAKYTIGRIGTLVAEEGIQLHGGIGMTRELPLSHFAKRLIMIDHQLGDQVHHLKRYMFMKRTK
ncbi:alkylation response protein AidB-like acyl-CoA dehydrogenase [Paraburkholderia sp. GAS348]